MNLKEIASKETTLSSLMAGRDKATTREMVEHFPDGFTVAAVDLVETPTATYSVVTVKEVDGIFYCGGLLLTKIVKAWVAQEGSIEAVNASLAQQDVKILLEESRTLDNKNLTKVTVL